MIIIAKFASVCPCCSSRIAAGEKVEWSKGEKARHAACDAPSARKAPKPKAPARPHARKEPRDGERLISRRSTGRGDRYDVGQTARIRGIEGAWIVVSEWLERPCEDNGQYDWMCCALVRPADATEALDDAAVRAAREQANARNALSGWVRDQVRSAQHATNEMPPPGSWRYSVRSTLAGSTTLYLAEGALWLVDSSYDDCRQWRMPISAEQVSAVCEMMAALSTCTRHEDCRRHVELGAACREAS